MIAFSKTRNRSKSTRGILAQKNGKLPKVKKISVSKAKNKAWNVFSQYIRQKYADSNGIVKCSTCPQTGHWKEFQAGHYIDGRTNTLLYDEMLVHPQCIRCNLFLHGNKVHYTVFMIDKYGLTIEGLKALAQLRSKTKPMKAFEHLEVYEKYNQLCKELPCTEL